jgi:hypothetical protein
MLDIIYPLPEVTFNVAPSSRTFGCGSVWLHNLLIGRIGRSAVRCGFYRPNSRAPPLTRYSHHLIIQDQDDSTIPSRHFLIQKMDETSSHRRKTFRWPFKGIKQGRHSNPPNSAQPSNYAESSEFSDAVVPDYDTQRTRNRHLEVCKLLVTSIKASQQENTRNFLDFPELDGEHASFDEFFLQKVNHLLESRRDDIKDETAWSKCRNTIECIFTAFSPFFKNFLSIAKNAQSVFLPDSLPL